MKREPKSLTLKLEQRKENISLRKLALPNYLIDFASNDYLGFAHSSAIFNQTHDYLLENNLKINGATGSRLISGNHNLYQITEDFIANFHQSKTALIFNLFLLKVIILPGLFWSKEELRSCESQTRSVGCLKQK